MHKSKLIISILVMSVFVSLILAACAPGNTPTAAVEPVTLKVALLPILDTLPMYVAQQEGLFEKHGIQVEIIPVASAAERDQVIVAEQADGMINESISALLYNKDEIQVQIIRYARAASAEDALFSILAAANSEINSPEDLKGVEIGISEGTIIEYITDRLLQEQGFSDQEIQTIAVPKIADRMALLGSGELKAATLPEPFASLAMQQGARLILDDRQYPEYSYSTIAFRKPFIDQHPEAMRAFLAAIEEATSLINEDPSKYTNLLVEQKLVPAPLEGSFGVPPFVTAGAPTEAQWQDAMNWSIEEGLISNDVSYQDSVNASFLP